MIHWIYDPTIYSIQFIITNNLVFIHVFSILDFENYYKNRFLFLFSILIKLFDHEIVNCEIIHDVSMLIYILATSKQLPHRRPEKKPKSWLFSNVRRKKSQNSGLLSNFRRIIFKTISQKKMTYRFRKPMNKSKN